MKLYYARLKYHKLKHAPFTNLKKAKAWIKKHGGGGISIRHKK